MNKLATQLLGLFAKIVPIFFIWRQGKKDEASKTNNLLLNAHNRLQSRLNRTRDKSNTK